MTYFNSYEPGFPACWEGLELYTAEDCTPRWYGVSSGNGNNGVSHMFADYYVRTADPFTLAKAALVDSFKPQWQAQAAEECEVDGEADYTISAVLYEPLDRDPPQSNFHCNVCNSEWTGNQDADSAVCEHCEDGGDVDETELDSESWCEFNGAYMIVEIFPLAADDMRDSRPHYDSLGEALSAKAIELATD